MRCLFAPDPKGYDEASRLLWRALMGFLSLAPKRPEARLQLDAQQLREALRHV